jgi:hypothetical protein
MTIEHQQPLQPIKETPTRAPHTEKNKSQANVAATLQAAAKYKHINEYIDRKNQLTRES